MGQPFPLQRSQAAPWEQWTEGFVSVAITWALAPELPHPPLRPAFPPPFSPSPGHWPDSPLNIRSSPSPELPPGPLPPSTHSPSKHFFGCLLYVKACAVSKSHELEQEARWETRKQVYTV